MKDQEVDFRKAACPVCGHSKMAHWVRKTDGKRVCGTCKQMCPKKDIMELLS